MDQNTGIGSGNRPLIRIGPPEVRGDTLIVKCSYNKGLEPFLASGLFYAKYDFSLEDVPPSLLSIPALGLLAPLGWLTGADIVAGDTDKDYVESLSAVSGEFKKLYPAIPFSGALSANSVSTRSEWNGERCCVLYSGGVDSTCTLIRNMGKHPTALTVRGGPDLPLHDDRYWEIVRERTGPFARALAVESHLAETNALGMVNQQALRERFRSKLKTGWWEELAFGLFLLSMSAPYTYHGRIGNVMIGSSNTAKDQVPWGSTPMTDEKVRWGSVRVIHESYDLSRLDKLRQIVLPYAAGHGGAIPLRVCIGRRSLIGGSHLNCGECAKCMVVEMALLLSGADAADWGFNISPPTLSHLRRELEEGRFGRSYDPATWAFIKAQSKSPPAELVAKHQGLGEFLDWFAGWDERTKDTRKFIDRVAPPGSRRREIARAGFGRKEGS